jgi:hypothetical protein
LARMGRGDLDTERRRTEIHRFARKAMQAASPARASATATIISAAT